jgi:hypothetical protein
MMGEFTRIIHVRVPWGPGGLGRGFGKCRGRIGGVDSEQAAKVAIACRAKPGAPPGYVRLSPSATSGVSPRRLHFTYRQLSPPPSSVPHAFLPETDCRVRR